MAAAAAADAGGGAPPAEAAHGRIIGRGTWIDKLADDLLRREEWLGRDTDMVRVESGLGASGIPHLGSLGDAVRAYGVKLAVEATGHRSELIAYSDDLDGLRKVPDGMPASLAEHIAKPVSLVPDPDGSYASYGERMSSLLLEGLDALGIEYVFRRARDSYAGGAFRAQTSRILSEAGRIGERIEEMVGQSKFRGALPYFPVCGACQRLYTARAVSYDPRTESVSYECSGADIGGSFVAGCGHAGESRVGSDLGKLAWKVEFAARWQAFDVRFEAYGKDIMDSVRVNDWVCEEVLGTPPPHHARYEMFLDKGGRKISKSSGNVLTAQRWLRYASPESILLLMYKRITGARELGLEDVPALMDEYADLAAAYYGDGSAAEEGPGRRSKERGLFEYVHLLDPPAAEQWPSRPPPRYGILVEMCRTFGTVGGREGMVVRRLAEGHGYGRDDAWGSSSLADMVGMAARYADEQAPAKEAAGGSGGSEGVNAERGEAVRAALSDLADALERIAAEKGGAGEDGMADRIQGEVFACARARGARPRDMFKALYGMLVGSPRGPRIGPLIAEMGPAGVCGIIREGAA